MKKLIILILTVGTFFAILAGGMVFLAATVVSANSGYSATEETLILSGELKNGVREIKVEAFKYGFKPEPIVVNKGEKVKLIATATDVQHGIAISGYGINVSLRPGKSEVIEFTANKAGDFHIHCSVYCGTGHSKMHGSLIVK